MVLSVWPRGQTPVSGAEIEESLQIKEATDVKVQDQNMLTCFFDISCIIHFEFVSEGITVNQIFYVVVLRRLFGAVRRMRGELWRDRSLILHHDNVSAYSSLWVPRILAGNASPSWIIRRTILTWLRLSSVCFQNSKSVLKGKPFSDVEDSKSSVKNILTDIPLQDFKNC
jgi:hypothetical protein